MVWWSMACCGEIGDERTRERERERERERDVLQMEKEIFDGRREKSIK